MPSLTPVVLPWAAVLALFALKPNRSLRAGWVLLPLGLLVAGGFILEPALESLGSVPWEFFTETVGPVAFGLAGLWLLSPLLAGRHRMLGFFGMVLAQAAVGGVAFGASRELAENSYEAPFLAIFQGCWLLASALALSLAGFTCRRVYRPVRFSLWLLLWLLAGWISVVAAFVVPDWLSGGGISWGDLGSSLILAALISFVTLLPFLVLSFVNPFFRERFRALLRLPGSGEAPASVLSGSTAA